MNHASNRARFRTTACAAAALALLPGCAIVRSVPAGSGGEGIGYMLPRALLPVELVYDGSGLELRIHSPVLVGDTRHTYVLQRSGNVFTSDRATVTVNAATGLLSAIDVKSVDKTIPAITKLASGLKAEAADGATALTVFRGLLDPAWDRAAMDAFNQRISAAASAHLARLASENACAPQAAADPCKSLQALAAELARAGFTVELEGGAVPAREPADCSAGFCYRMNVPHVVTLNGPGTSNSAAFGLPNRSPTFVMPLERWAFVKTTHDVELEGGVFKSVTSDRPSSALALAAAPLEVAKGVLGAVSEVVQLKIDLSGKEKQLADAKVAEIEAQSALDKALIEKAGGKAEAAILGETAGRAAAVVSIRVGPPSRFDATKGLVVPAASGGAAASNPVEAPASPGGQAAPGSPGTARRN